MAKLLGGTRIYGDAVVDNNLLLSGEIRGPASLIIDPAVVGDNTGTVIIKGDLTVNGTINYQGGNSSPFDQSLNTTDDVLFNSALIGNITFLENEISAVDAYGQPTLLQIGSDLNIVGNTKISGNLEVDIGILIVNGTEIINYTLPTASDTTLGGIKIGTGLTIDGGGFVSADPYTLPTATDSVLGGIKIDGSTLTFNGSGQLVANYALPIASDTTLGGIKIGTGLSIDGVGVVSVTGGGGSSYDQSLNTTDDVVFNSALIGDISIVGSQISALNAYGETGLLDIASDLNITGNVDISGTLFVNGQEITNYSLPTATTSVLGGVKVDGTTITIDGNGVISGSNSYSLPTASDTTLGGIKIGTGLTIDGSGVVSVTGGGSLSIDDLTDVDTTSTAPEINQALVWDGTNWVPGTPSSIIGVGNQSLTTSDPSQIVDEYDKTVYRTAKYLLQAISGNEVHATEVTVTHNDAETFIVEYGTVYTGAASLITVSADLDSTNVYLKVTPANASTVIDFTRISITARVLGAAVSSPEGDLMLQSGTEDLSSGSGSQDLMN
jgi:hypothetical protein